MLSRPMTRLQGRHPQKTSSAKVQKAGVDLASFCRDACIADQSKILLLAATTPAYAPPHCLVSVLALTRKEVTLLKKTPSITYCWHHDIPDA